MAESLQMSPNALRQWKTLTLSCTFVVSTYNSRDMQAGDEMTLQGLDQLVGKSKEDGQRAQVRPRYTCETCKSTYQKILLIVIVVV